MCCILVLDTRYVSRIPWMAADSCRTFVPSPQASCEACLRILWKAVNVAGLILQWTLTELSEAHEKSIIKGFRTHVVRYICTRNRQSCIPTWNSLVKWWPTGRCEDDLCTWWRQDEAQAAREVRCSVSHFVLWAVNPPPKQYCLLWGGA